MAIGNLQSDLHMSRIFIMFKQKKLGTLGDVMKSCCFPGFVRDCRVFAVFAGFTDNTSGMSAYQVGSSEREISTRIATESAACTNREGCIQIYQTNLQLDQDTRTTNSVGPDVYRALVWVCICLMSVLALQQKVFCRGGASS